MRAALGWESFCTLSTEQTCQQSKLFFLEWVGRASSGAASPLSKAYWRKVPASEPHKTAGDAQPVKEGRNGAGQNNKRRSGDNSGYITTPGPAVSWLLEEQIPGNQEVGSGCRTRGSLVGR
jgi:hypothetical protein